MTDKYSELQERFNSVVTVYKFTENKMSYLDKYEEYMEAMEKLGFGSEFDEASDQSENGFDNVNHPKHYKSHPSGVECIQITEHMGFCLGNALKYIWRADEKGKAVEDLEKAVWYLNREITKRKKENDNG